MRLGEYSDEIILSLECLIQYYYIVCFSQVAIGGALSRDQKSSDHVY